jgi:hypothetical protein
MRVGCQPASGVLERRLQLRRCSAAGQGRIETLPRVENMRHANSETSPAFRPADRRKRLSHQSHVAAGCQAASGVMERRLNSYVATPQRGRAGSKRCRRWRICATRTVKHPRPFGGLTGGNAYPTKTMRQRAVSPASVGSSPALLRGMRPATVSRDT